jgi:hypothetical protein
MRPSPTKQFTFRLPKVLVSRLETCLTRMRGSIGIHLTRADLVRILLTYALDHSAGEAHRLLARRCARAR